MRNVLMLLDSGASHEYQFMRALLGPNAFRFEQHLSEIKLAALAMWNPNRLIDMAETIALQEWDSADCSALRNWVEAVWM